MLLSPERVSRLRVSHLLVGAGILKLLRVVVGSMRHFLGGVQLLLNIVLVVKEPFIGPTIDQILLLVEIHLGFTARHVNIGPALVTDHVRRLGPA